MTIEELGTLLGWSALINYLILLLWFTLFSLCHQWIYRLHTRWFRLQPEIFDSLHYGLMGGYKLLIIVFNFIPWLIMCLAF